MAYTTINKSTDYFNTKLYTGNGNTDHAQTGVGFQPDWTWIKDRSAAESHFVFDAVRGHSKYIFPNGNNAEGTDATGILKSFDSDGFTLGTQTNVNQSGHTNVAWNWKAAGASGSGTTAGSGTSKAYSYIVNTTAGFSITKFVGNGTSGHKIPHSLGATPKMFVVKNRSRGTTDWQVYSPVGDPTDALALNQSDGTGDSESYWSDEAPDATYIVVGGGGAVNYNGDDLVCYAWKEVPGYSKFGSYTGNGNTNGSFIYLGFKPAFFMIKRTDGSGDKWRMWDNKRSPFNLVDDSLACNETSAEYDDASVSLDFLSNGVQMKMSGGGAGNGSGESYIYIAFAEEPLVANVGAGIPATAR